MSRSLDFPPPVYHTPQCRLDRPSVCALGVVHGQGSRVDK